MTEFISEQVSHHPPVSAFVAKAIKHNLSLTCFPRYSMLSSLLPQSIVSGSSLGGIPRELRLRVNLGIH